MNDFTKGSYSRCDRDQASLQDGYKVDVLCIIDKDHQRCVIAVNHFSKFLGIKSMVSPQLVCYDTENGATLLTNFKKNEDQIIIWMWEKRKWKVSKDI